MIVLCYPPYIFILIYTQYATFIYLFICSFIYLFIYSKFCRSSLIIRSVSDHFEAWISSRCTTNKRFAAQFSVKCLSLDSFRSKACTLSRVRDFFGSDTVHVLLTPGFSRNRLSRFTGCHRIAQLGIFITLPTRESLASPDISVEDCYCI